MTFLADYLAGRAHAEDIHDHIDDWHDYPNVPVPLGRYLGMTSEQYASWVERGQLPERQPGRRISSEGAGHTGSSV